MIRIPTKKIFNSYIIETYNYNSVKSSIREYAITLGFERSYVESDNHPDIIYIESNSIIKIDTIRTDIIESSIYAPKLASKKIYVVYDSINLETDTQNALLKTLEEPLEFDIFFLVTSNSNKLLETIRSRCFIIKDNDESDYKELLKLSYADEAIRTLANVKFTSMDKRMEFAEIFMNKENNLKDLIRLYRYLLRDVLFYKLTYDKDNIYFRELEDSIMSLASTYSLSELGTFVDNLDKLVEANNAYVNKKIAIFNFFEV